jgi:hypothetical protein
LIEISQGCERAWKAFLVVLSKVSYESHRFKPSRYKHLSNKSYFCTEIRPCMSWVSKSYSIITRN